MIPGGIEFKHQTGQPWQGQYLLCFYLCNRVALHLLHRVDRLANLSPSIRF